MFSVGDKVIHHIHGAGIITAKKELQITTMPGYYFVIQMEGSPSTLIIPADKAEQRLRPVSKMAKLRRLLKSKLAGKPHELSSDYKERTERIGSKLQSGEIEEWIEVVRDLSHRGQQTSLSESDKRQLNRAVDLLSGELALAQGIGQEEAKLRLSSIVIEE